MKKGILFLLCLAGGVLFGVVFFAGFGAEFGYDWTLACICAGGGLIFAVAFFLVWLVVEKFSKPISFEDLDAQLKLQEHEKEFESYEARFHARMPMGSRLRSAVCETYIYLLSDRLRISFSYFRKINWIEVDYNDLCAEIDEDGFFSLQWRGRELMGRLLEEDVAAVFYDGLKERGVSIQSLEPFSEI